jgi:alkanesulfonate monooxygenase SsuD/methylene tetrahydromethanopterin reductase-like flavin-dependent oxidoreductase (luciferase family)
VADTADEAARLALPQLLQMVALRTGQPLTAQPLVEEAEKRVADGLPPAQADLVEAMRSRWVIGDPEQAGEELEKLAATYEVDEVMVNPVGGAVAGTAADTAPGRERTLELLSIGRS